MVNKKAEEAEEEDAARLHQQPEVNYFDVLEKGDFPCILDSESLVFRGNRPFRNGVNSSLLVAGGSPRSCCRSLPHNHQPQG